MLNFDKQNLDAAIADYTKAIELTKDKKALSVLYYSRGFIYNKKSSNDLMLADFQKATETDTGQLTAEMRKDIAEKSKTAEIGKPNQTADDYIRSAEKYSGEYASRDQLAIAADLLTKAIALKPDSADLYKKRGMINLKRDSEAARADFSSALKYSPSDAELYLLRGDSYGFPQFGTANEAAQISDYTTAINLAPNNLKAREKRGERLLMKAILSRSLDSAKEFDKDFAEIVKIKQDEESYRLQIAKRDYFLTLTESNYYSPSYCEKSDWSREAVKQAYSVFQSRGTAFAKQLKSRLEAKNICDFSQINVEVTNWKIDYEGRHYALFIGPFGKDNTTFSSHPIKNGYWDPDRIYFSYRGEARQDKKQRNRFYLVFNRSGPRDENGNQEKIDKITWTFELWGDELIGTNGDQRIVMKKGY